jgi:hypothetical protein
MRKILFIAIAVLLGACATQPNTDQTQLSQIKATSQLVATHWIARHPQHIYCMCLLEGLGAFTDFTHLDELDAGTFTSYIIGHDMDITDFEAARETGRFLAQTAAMDIGWDDKWQVRSQIESGIDDAIHHTYLARYYR